MHAPTSHLPHVLMLLKSLERARENGAVSMTMPSDVFLMSDQPSHLWELVALRIHGLDALVLGGVKFRKQEAGAGKLARQSLVSFLSSPEREIGLVDVPKPGHLIEVMLAETPQALLQFLERCRKGAEFPTMLVAQDDVELAFDFRLENPSSMHNKESDQPAQRYLFRTVGGHLLTALHHGLSNQLNREDPFLALTQPIQHTIAGDQHLPTLVVHRRFLTMAAPLRGILTPWLNHTLPFNVQLSSSENVLDPRLDDYRVYRNRLIEEERLALRSA